MLKASALYLVIVISLVISVVCSALIVAAYMYFSQYQAKFRADRLQNNISSGVNILLTTTDSTYRNGKSFSLFDNTEDSVSLQKTSWGIYDICTVKAFIQKDTLYKVFSIANAIDSSKWAALYLIDEDRPISVGGNTMINGDAYLPKAGIRPANIDTEVYIGDKRMVIGKIHDSDRKLPKLQENRLRSLNHFFITLPGSKQITPKTGTLSNSFMQPTLIFNWGKRVDTISGVTLKGNIILYSDTTLVIDSTASLSNILVFAKGIKVKSGFHGNCQLFASDSVSVERNCRFDYPSGIGTLRFKAASVALPEKISIGENTVFNGLLFTWEKAEHQLPPIISLGKKARVNGQVYSQGIFNLRKNAVINGSVFTSRFLYQSEFTMYENYLINATINARALSRYYLSGDIAPAVGKQKKVMQWLEVK